MFFGYDFLSNLLFLSYISAKPDRKLTANWIKIIYHDTSHIRKIHFFNCYVNKSFTNDYLLGVKEPINVISTVLHKKPL